MNRLDTHLKKLKRSRQKAVVFFVTAGDPSLEITRDFLRFAQSSGVDIVELGIPFSDPLADGPIIQASSQRSIARGTNLKKVLTLVRHERKLGLTVPLVLMTSLNIIHRYGIRSFERDAARAGVDGAVIPDLPYEEIPSVFGGYPRGVYLIPMITPTTRKNRRVKILNKAKGFVYYVSVTGVTGLRQNRKLGFKSDIASLKRHTRIPVLVGFGVTDAAQARRIASFSDGVILGSALVQRLALNKGRVLNQSTQAWIRSVLRAVKGGR